MKLIIDIPKEVVVAIENGFDYRYDIHTAIAQGTPYEARLTGHWVKTVGENGVTSAARCSECGFEDNRYMLFRYCPNCDADMRGDRE
jgi:hypothetical protein